MFSATGRLLPGSEGNPEFKVYAHFNELEKPYGGATLPIPRCSVNMHIWNSIGYTPVVSTITGLARALLGIVHSIIHLATAIFDRANRSAHFDQMGFGLKHMARGIIEAIPIIGNLVLYNVDEQRQKAFVDDVKVELGDREKYEEAYRKRDAILLISDAGGTVAAREIRTSASARPARPV